MKNKTDYNWTIIWITPSECEVGCFILLQLDVLKCILYNFFILYKQMFMMKNKSLNLKKEPKITASPNEYCNIPL